MVMRFIKRITSIFKRKREEATDPTMDNVVNSMFLCKPLYDELKTKCHPDRYTDIEQSKRAELLFQSLQKHIDNYNEMLVMKEQINSLWDERNVK